MAPCATPGKYFRSPSSLLGVERRKRRHCRPIAVQVEEQVPGTVGEFGEVGRAVQGGRTLTWTDGRHFGKQVTGERFVFHVGVDLLVLPQNGRAFRAELLDGDKLLQAIWLSCQALRDRYR